MLGRNALRFAVGEVGSRLPLLVLEISLARTLGPSIYGVWSVIQTFATYGNFLHFGVSSSLARLEPRLIQTARQSELHANRAATYGFQLLVISVIMLAYVAVGLLVPSIPERIGGLQIGLALMLVVLAQQMTITAQSSALNMYKIGAASVARLVFAFIFLGLGLLSAQTKAPIQWLTLSWSMALAIALGILSFLSPGLLARPTIDLGRTFVLLADGFPIMLQGVLRFALMSMDKLAVFALANPVVVGYYGIGSLAASLTGLSGSIVARVSLPTLLRLRSRSDETKEICLEFDRMLSLIQILTVSVIFPISAFEPLFIHMFLPRYEPAIWTIGILAVVGGFVGLGQALNDITMSLGIKAAVLHNTLITLVMQAFLIALAWTIAGNIEAVAQAVLVSMIFLAGRSSCLCMVAVGFDSRETRQRLITLATRTVLAVVGCLIALGLQNAAIQRLPQSVFPLIIANVILISIFAIGVWCLISRSRIREYFK